MHFCAMCQSRQLKLTVLIHILLKYIGILPTIHDFLLASIKSETLLKQVNYYYNFLAIFQIIVINNAGYIQKCHHSNVIIAALTLTKCTKNNFKKMVATIVKKSHFSAKEVRYLNTR